MNGEEEKKDEQQRQQTILLTGFSGWGLISTNPSQLIAERVGNLVPRLANGRVQLVTATLPVQWEAATEMLRALIAQLRPIAVLCLGLSQGISSLHVERVAVNLCNGKDTCGASRVDDPVVSGGPDAYLSTLPSRLMQTRVQRAGVPCALSYSAGTFLCNCVMYTALHASKTIAENGHAENGDAAGTGFIAGFIHVPLLPGHAAAQGRDVQSSMSLECAATGVRAALEAICEKLPAVS